MKTLILFRHAKTERPQAGMDDHARVLTDRGRRAAPIVAAWIANQHAPSHVLVSTAARTRETWHLAAASFRGKPAVQFRDDLYLVEAPALLAAVRTMPKTAETVMIVGHNPGLHELALLLVGAGSAELREALSEKFPTAAAAVITFDTPAWRPLASGRGTLVAFTTPKRLAADDDED